MTISIVLVTGQSGSGKSTAMHTLEDQGYFCVDNIPTRLAQALIDMIQKEKHYNKIAFVMDIREQNFIHEAPDLIRRLQTSACTLQMIFLKSNKDTIIRRYSQTRRLHPLDHDKGLLYAINEEEQLLLPLENISHHVVDTSNMSPHQLRAYIINNIIETNHTLHVCFMSFGFKYGIPLESNIVLDVRFLDNPYFQTHLRHLTGLSQEVSAFVLGLPETQKLIDHTREFLYFLLPQYQQEGKHYVTIAIGCTGGKHRSVAIAEALQKQLSNCKLPIHIYHRDIAGEAP